MSDPLVAQENTNKIRIICSGYMLCNLFVMSFLFFWFYVIYRSESFNSITVMWLYTAFVASSTIVTAFLLRHQQTPQNVATVSLLFASIAIITVIFSPFRDIPFVAGIFGNIRIPLYSVSLFAIVCLSLKIIVLCRKHAPIITLWSMFGFIVTSFTVMFIAANDMFNQDFNAVTGIISLVMICAFVDRNMWQNAHISHKILIVASICITLFFTLSNDNRTARAVILVVPVMTLCTIYVLHKIFQRKIALRLISLLPISALMVLTLSILVAARLIDTQAFEGSMFRTVWLRATLWQSILQGMSWQDWIFGYGWGLSYLPSINATWVEGTGKYLGNVYTGQYVSNYLGGGFDHAHNELIQFLGAGILSMSIYILILFRLSWDNRQRPIVIAMLTTYTTLLATWFHVTEDTIFLMLAFGFLAASNTKVTYTYTPPILIKTKAIAYKYFSVFCGGILIVYAVFATTIHIPYVWAVQKNKITREMYDNKWYTGFQVSGYRLESVWWRNRFNRAVYKLQNSKKSFNKEFTTYLVDMLDTMKIVAKQEGSIALYELADTYNYLFNIRSENLVLEKIREREYGNWATIMLMVNDELDGRPDLFVKYMRWHYHNHFDTAIYEVTKRILAKNPNNAVALYWRSAIFRRQGKMVEADAYLKKAFKNNITRYQKTTPDEYEQYKHLIDPIYQR